MPLIEANELHLMYDRAGEGPPLLMIGGTGWDLRQQPSPLDSVLVQHFDVVCFDQRGMGQSDKPKGPYRLLDYATDAAALLANLGWDKAHVVGYSFGGMVAQELAIAWPDRIQSLVLAASTAGGAGGSSYPIHDLVDLDPVERARRGLEIADLRFTPEWQAQHPDEARERIESRVKKQSEFINDPGMRDGMLAQLEARSHHNTFERLGHIAAPTLVLAGKYDGQAPLAAQQAMQTQIPNSQMRILDGSHGFIYESNAVFDEIIRFGT